MESVVPVCRICLNASYDYIDFQDRFECKDCSMKNSADDINYLQCVRLCTNLPIEEDDEGPQCLCTECEGELQIVYGFLQKARNSHLILQDCWQKNTSNEIIEHTEITIEKHVLPENTGNNELVKEDIAIDPYESSNDCSELSNDLFENDSSDLSKDDDITEMEHVIINGSEPNESSQEIEYSPENPQDTRIFIPRKYKCQICSRLYSTERLLKVHLNYHKRRNAGCKPYSCKICGCQFSLQRYLTQHMIEHEDYRETYKCQYCEKEYNTKTALISHKRIHQEESLNCGECGKQFNGTYEYKVHLRFHKREKEQGMNNCEICGKEYSSKRYLSQHMIVHVNDRKTVKCSYCNKEYVTKTALDNHKRLHEGLTTKCSVCEKEFTRNCELKIHMRFHKREYPFKCTMCEKKFAIKGHLRTHMWQHQGIKLKCEECGKLFGSTKAFKEHSYTHSEMPYPCEFCDKAFPSRQKYKIHLEKMHCNERDEHVEGSTSTKKNKIRNKKINYVKVIRDEEENENI